MWPRRRPKPWPRAGSKTDHIHAGCSPAAAVSCGRNPIVAFFSIAIVPLSGEASPRRSANKVDLPAPLGPTNPIRSPRLTWSETSSKSARPAKDFESWETVSIAESAQCSLVRCPAQLVNHESTLLRKSTARQARMNTNGLSLTCGLPEKPRCVILSSMKLRLVLEHDPQTKRWAAFFPELPGCASAGDTEEEAVRNAKEALDLWFEPAPVTFPAGAKVLEVALR